MEVTKIQFGKKVKESRLAMGLTQHELGEILGVTSNQIRLWEKHISLPRQSTAKKVYGFFDWKLPLDWIAACDGRLPLGIGICLKCCKEFPLYRTKTKYCSTKCSHSHKQLGEKHHKWNGGRSTTAGGYIQIKMPNHPNAAKNGYVLEHRYVMEQILGRTLESNERVHHRNGNRADNRPENLELWKVLKKDPSGIRASDYHCAGCRCFQEQYLSDGEGI